MYRAESSYDEANWDRSNTLQIGSGTEKRKEKKVDFRVRTVEKC